MKSIRLSAILLVLLVTTLVRAQRPCSTEKVNHADCTFTVDRRYPVTFPTLQMDHGKHVLVRLKNPLAFETVTLDETGATLLPGTDQGAALIKSAIPDLAGLTFFTTTLPAAPPVALQLDAHILEAQPGQPPPPPKHDDKIESDLGKLNEMVAGGYAALNPAVSELAAEVPDVYTELSQALSPLPRPVLPLPDAPAATPCRIAHPNPAAPLAALGTPNPWDCYSNWRSWMLCELRGECVTQGDDDVEDAAIAPPVHDVLGEIGRLLIRMGNGKSLPPGAIFDQKGFGDLAKKTGTAIGKLPDKEERDGYTADLEAAVVKGNELAAKIAIVVSTLTSVQADLLKYYTNIRLVQGPVIEVPQGNPAQGMRLGMIFDPRAASQSSNMTYPKFLGRQVVFAVNTVNQISTSRASVTTGTAKTSIATITVIYANPIFEASAGVIFSFVHDRTFTNQTLASGAVQIQEVKTRPEVVPFVAGNWKLHDFVFPGDHRRGGVYATAYLGLNPDTVLPEYGGGPTLSWRSVMLSAFYERAHDTRLVGATVGQTLCGATAASTPPACTSTPAAPTTSPYATNGFGVAISIRVPTTFAAGTGGISQ